MLLKMENLFKEKSQLEIVKFLFDKYPDFKRHVSFILSYYKKNQIIFDDHNNGRKPLKVEFFGIAHKFIEENSNENSELKSISNNKYDNENPHKSGWLFVYQKKTFINHTNCLYVNPKDEKLHISLYATGNMLKRNHLDKIESKGYYIFEASTYMMAEIITYLTPEELIQLL